MNVRVKCDHPSYARALDLLNAFDAAERARLIVGGGLAVELLTGGTGARPSLDDLDLVVPVRARLLGPHGSSVHDPNRFHEFVDHLIDTIRPHLSNMGLHDDGVYRISGPSAVHAPEAVHLRRVKDRFTVDFLSANLLPNLPLFAGRFTTLVDLTLENSVMGASMLRGVRVPTAMAMLMWKLGVGRVDAALTPSDARFEGAIKDLIDCVSIVQSIREDDLQQYLSEGMTDLERYNREVMARGPVRQPTEASFCRLARFIESPDVKRRLLERVEAENWDLTADFSLNGMRRTAEIARAMDTTLARVPVTPLSAKSKGIELH